MTRGRKVNVTAASVMTATIGKRSSTAVHPDREDDHQRRVVVLDGAGIDQAPQQREQREQGERFRSRPRAAATLQSATAIATEATNPIASAEDFSSEPGSTPTSGAPAGMSAGLELTGHQPLMALTRWVSPSERLAAEKA